MLIRFDIRYLQNQAYCKEFPCSPATLFQAIVAANAYRLDAITELLEILEKGKCVRIDSVEPVERIRVSPAVPRLQKLSELKSKGIYSNLIKDEVIFVLQDATAHVSYYFEVENIPAEHLTQLSLHTLGRGRSRCISSVSVIDTLPQERQERKVWLPTSGKGRRMNVVYDGFLSNL